jgi:phage FluMu gp28-like protein
MKYQVNLNVLGFIHDALYNDKRHTVIAAGRQVGKTYNAAIWMLEMMLMNRNARGLWVDTTQSNLDAYIKRVFKPVLGDLYNECYYNERKGYFEFPTGSYIDLRSSQKPENLEGQNYSHYVLNEAGIILKKPMLWQDSIYPMVENGHGKIIGTPKGKNLFHQLFQRGQSGEGDWISYRFTWQDTPLKTEEQEALAKKNLPEAIYRQNVLGEYVDDAGAVFRHIAESTRDPQEGLRTDIMAVDLAKHSDYTVITFVNREHKQVIDFDRFNELDWGFQKNRIVSSWRERGEPTLVIDSTGVGDPIFDDLRNAGIPVEGYKFTNKSKNELIQGLSIAMDNGNFYFPNDPVAIAELEVFGYDITPSGNIRYNAPSGFHDDIVISYALANYLLQNENEFILEWI